MSLKEQKGFTLIEVAITLLVIAGISTTVLLVYQSVLDTNAKLKEQQNIYQISKSMNTFLAVNSFIPCPDTDGDGLENRTIASTGEFECADREGGLPFNDLGVKEKDAWGNPYYYRVHQRAESATYVNDICEPASVLGRSGPRSKADLWLCPDTNIYYCADSTSSNNCDSVCSSLCTNSTDPRPSSNVTSAPFFHLATPPYGTVAGSYNLEVTDEVGNQVDEGVVAVVISWGNNGSSVNRDNCTNGSVNELENCDDDRDFVNTITGENRDFMTWVTVNQAKVAIIGSGNFR